MQEEFKKLTEEMKKLQIRMRDLKRKEPYPRLIREKQSNKQDLKEYLSKVYSKKSPDVKSDDAVEPDDVVKAKLCILFGSSGYLEKINIALFQKENEDYDAKPQSHPQLHEYKAVLDEFFNRFCDPADLGGQSPDYLKKVLKSLERISLVLSELKEINDLFQEVFCSSAKDILAALRKFEYDRAQDGFIFKYYRKLYETVSTSLQQAFISDKDDPLAILQPEMKQLNNNIFASWSDISGPTITFGPPHNLILLLTAEFKKSHIDFCKKEVTQKMIFREFKDFIVNRVYPLNDIIMEDTAGKLVFREKFREDLLTLVVGLAKTIGLISIYDFIRSKLEQDICEAELLKDEKDLQKYDKLTKQAEILNHTLTFAENFSFNLSWPKSADPTVGEIIKPASLFHQDLRVDLIWSLTIPGRKMHFSEDIKVVNQIDHLVLQIVALINLLSRQKHPPLILSKIIEKAKEAYNYTSVTPLIRLEALKKEYDDLIKYLRGFIVKSHIYRNFNLELPILRCLSKAIQRDFLGHAVEENFYECLLYFFEYKIGGVDEKFNLPEALHPEGKPLQSEVRLVLNVMRKKVNALTEEGEKTVFTSLNRILLYICQNGLKNCLEQFLKYQDSVVGKQSYSFGQSDSVLLAERRYRLLDDFPDLKENYLYLCKNPKHFPRFFQLILFQNKDEDNNDVSLLHVAARAGHLDIVKALVCFVDVCSPTVNMTMEPAIHPIILKDVLQYVRVQENPSQQVVDFLQKMIGLIWSPEPLSVAPIRHTPTPSEREARLALIKLKTSSIPVQELKPLKGNAQFVFNTLIKYTPDYRKKIQDVGAGKLFTSALGKLKENPAECRLVESHFRNKIITQELTKDHPGFSYFLDQMTSATASSARLT